ncbi:MAG: hypothetical protein ACOX8R_07630 [Bacillota bacterium]|jgi:hypothetical protein
MKRSFKILGLVMVLMMVFSIFSAGVSAAWDQYQGNPSHNGQITGTAPLINQLGEMDPAVSSHCSSLTLPYNGNIWAGVDTTPVMETYGGETYAYVLYNGGTYNGSTTPGNNGLYPGTGGTRMAKIKCSDGSIVKTVALYKTGGFQLSTPYLDTAAGLIYVATTNFYSMLDNDEFESTSAWNLGSGAVIDTTNGYVTIPAGTCISQTFNYPLSSSANTQLTSAVKLVSGSSATVTYKLTKPNGTDVTLKTLTVTSSNNWTYIEELGNGDVYATGNYTITVCVTGGDVIIDYVKYSRQTTGISAVDRNLTSLTPISGTDVGGQINTPVMKYGNYIYYGTYNGGNKYYQHNLTNHSTVSFTGNSHFYWAGAIQVSVDGVDYIVFGSDAFTSNGTKHTYLYYRPVNDFGNTGVGGYYDLGASAGNIRSTISTDGTYLYFTSQGLSNASYIWRVETSKITNLTANDVTSLQLSGNSSTSTPAISANGKIYVGYYNGFSTGGVDVIDQNAFSLTNIIDGDPPGPVQSSIIVYSPNIRYDYIYFTTNIQTGAGYCYRNSVLTNPNTAVNMWSTTPDTYTLQGMAAENGYLSFGNDHNNFYVVH